jgi:hypothetical protein
VRRSIRSLRFLVSINKTALAVVAMGGAAVVGTASYKRAIHTSDLQLCLNETNRIMERPLTSSNTWTELKRQQAQSIVLCLEKQAAASWWLSSWLPLEYHHWFAVEERLRTSAVSVVAASDDDNGHFIKRALEMIPDIVRNRRLPHFAKERFSDVLDNPRKQPLEPDVTRVQQFMLGDWMELPTGKPTVNQVYRGIALLASCDKVDSNMIRLATERAGPELVQTPNYEAARLAIRHHDAVENKFSHLEARLVACLMHAPRPKTTLDKHVDGKQETPVRRWGWDPVRQRALYDSVWTHHVYYSSPVAVRSSENAHSSKAAHDDFWLEAMSRDVLVPMLLSQDLKFGNSGDHIGKGCGILERIPPQTWIADRLKQAAVHKFLGVDVALQGVIRELHRRHDRHLTMLAEMAAVGTG